MGTPRHSPLLTVPIKIVGIIVKAVVDTTATTPVVCKGIAKRLGIWRRAQKAALRQYDGSRVKGDKVVLNTSFVIPCAQTPSISPLISPSISYSTSPSKFSLNGEVFDLGHKDIILAHSWLRENVFSIDVPNSRLIVIGVMIPCTTHNIPSVTMLLYNSLSQWRRTRYC